MEAAHQRPESRRAHPVSVRVRGARPNHPASICIALLRSAACLDWIASFSHRHSRLWSTRLRQEFLMANGDVLSTDPMALPKPPPASGRGGLSDLRQVGG